LIDEFCDLARRAPSAGNTAATEFLVLDRPDLVDAYWQTTLTPEKRDTFRWQGLLRAPALIILLTRPDAYVDRYAESDKARRGLGESTDSWTQPFWWVDAGAVAQNLLLLAVDRGLGACLFGVFDHEEPLRQRFAVPSDRRIVCTIAIGHPDDEADQPGRSAARRRPPLDSIMFRGSWSGTSED
jgi:nitroreductase